MYLETLGHIDRTPGIPGSDKNSYETPSMWIFCQKVCANVEVAVPRYNRHHHHSNHRPKEFSHKLSTRQVCSQTAVAVSTPAIAVATPAVAVATPTVAVVGGLGAGLGLGGAVAIY